MRHGNRTSTEVFYDNFIKATKKVHQNTRRDGSKFYRYLSGALVLWCSGAPFTGALVRRCTGALFTAALTLALSSAAYANNLVISNVQLVHPSATAKTIQVQFNISWDNSWRNSTNRDAVWVFVKYTTQGAAPYTWNHCTLKTSGANPAGFSIGTGTSVNIVVPTDTTGAFIERSANGRGTTNVTSVQLVWDWNAAGLTSASTAKVQVFGVEMTYIPQGSFYLGDANAAAVYGQFSNQAGNGGQPAVHIVNAGGFVLGSEIHNSNQVGMSAPDDFSDSTTATLPGAFPDGYNGFYLMKYEISQGEYIAFLNTLTRKQQINRVSVNVSGDSPVGYNVYVMVGYSGSYGAACYRNTICCPSSGNGTVNPITFSSNAAGETRLYRACNCLEWQDLCAYADWAALRPFTELEYEKACRGPNNAVAGEYAWGNTSITAASTISGSEDGTETITTIGANACYNNVTFSGGDGFTGPLRCGIFATPTSNRTRAGAGYYGNMDMSGNLFASVVCVGTPTGRGFQGTHGDGVLSSAVTTYEGNATNTDWPGIDGTPNRGVDGATGSGLKSAYYGSNLSNADLTVSSRRMSNVGSGTRSLSYSGRCARTYP
jgi:formylglycine-generating enzyme required for sulfatase activity